VKSRNSSLSHVCETGKKFGFQSDGTATTV